MKPVNGQLFYYVLLVYAVGMVAYIALPLNATVVVADTASITEPVAAAPELRGTAGTVEVIAHPVSINHGTAQRVPFVTTPDGDGLQNPVSRNDEPKSL